MAGIDYTRSVGRTVYAWSAAMRDPRDADEAGGRPPFGLLHPRSKHLPVDFLRTLRSALLEAAGVIVGPDAEDRIVSDLGIVLVEDAAFLRPGPRASQALNASAYDRFLRALASALTRRGVAVRANADMDDFSERLLQQTLFTSDAYLLYEDDELLLSRVVQAVWREHDANVMAFNRSWSADAAAVATNATRSSEPGGREQCGGLPG
jgi:hypothetical protein